MSFKLLINKIKKLFQKSDENDALELRGIHISEN
jgi:hypothetical protein